MDLQQFGWNNFFDAQCVGGPVGRVVLAERERFLVWTTEGEAQATVRGTLRNAGHIWPAVGDWVVLREHSTIGAVLERRTAITRKAPGKNVREQILAANVDVLFIVSGLDRDYNPRRLERYLSLAHSSGARPVILLNKADVRPDLRDVMEKTRLIAPAAPVFAVSATEGWGLELLSAQVAAAETAALIGSSGAGKSTILNRLLGSERQRTNKVRETDSRGRHTTTRRELLLMPDGWLLMDMPGLRELSIWAEPEQIDSAFDEIAQLANRCRFRDCTHQHEPGCAVLEADLDTGRLNNYQKLRRELAYLDRQSDSSLARETKRQWKLIHKAMRRNPKH